MSPLDELMFNILHSLSVTYPGMTPIQLQEEPYETVINLYADAGMTLLWYYVAFAVFAAFVVAYISMYGWDTFKELKDRFIK